MKGDGIYSAMVLNLPFNSSAFSFVVEIMNTTGTIDNGLYYDTSIVFWPYNFKGILSYA